MTRTVHRYRIDARIEGDIEFANPKEWQAALDEVAAIVTKLRALGAEVTEKSGPAKVRE